MLYSVLWIVYDLGCMYSLQYSFSEDYVPFLHFGKTSMHIGVPCCVVCSFQIVG